MYCETKEKKTFVISAMQSASISLLFEIQHPSKMKASILCLVAVATFKNVRCCPSSIKNPIIIGPTRDQNTKYAIYQGENYLTSQNLEFQLAVGTANYGNTGCGIFKGGIQN